MPTRRTVFFIADRTGITAEMLGLGDDTIDAAALGRFIHEAYDKAGLRRSDVDSGAVILTGEAIKRKNARAIVTGAQKYAMDLRPGDTADFPANATPAVVARPPDIKGYDDVYRKLIRAVELSDVSSSFAMERIKYSTALPVDFA